MFIITEMSPAVVKRYNLYHNAQIGSYEGYLTLTWDLGVCMMSHPEDP